MAGRMTQYRAVSGARVDQRRAPRHPVLLTHATIHERGFRPAEAMLDELSVYGCRLSCATQLESGTPIWLNLPQGDPVAATVVWSDGAQIGCRFDTSIPQALVRDLTRIIC
jgi:hypothetical protein